MLTVLATNPPVPNVILDDLASDLTSLSVVIRLAIAAALGALIGLERKMADKPADGRTMMLICAGAAAFTLLGLQIAADAGPEAITRIDSTRVLSYIISGIGFLGAGAILHSKKSVKGLTTAAAIWVAAAIGAACGLAKFDTALMLFAIVIAALWAPWMLHISRDDDDDDDDDDLGPGHRRFARRATEREPDKAREEPDEPGEPEVKSGGKGEKNDKPEKNEKPEKADKGDKNGKSGGKNGKSDKGPKGDK